MVTEFFGILNIPDADEVIKRIKINLAYKKPHYLKLTEFEGGVAGSVSIGEKYTSNVIQEGNTILLSDASIYNRHELIQKLSLDSKNINDTELLLKGYNVWNHQVVNYLNGDFAFAVFNTKTGELFCARDFPGVRPLYYSLYKDGIIFGSELKIIKAIFSKTAELNDDFFLDSLLNLISDINLTAYKNIYRLPPSHCLYFSRGKTKVEAYNELNPSLKIRFKNNNEYKDHLKHTLISAVEDRCKNISFLGSELSGGLDSSTVTSIAADYANQNNVSFSAFSNTLPDEHSLNIKDEKEYIRKMVGHKKMSWVEVNKTEDSVPDLIKNSLNIQDCFTQQRFHMFNTGIYKIAGVKDVQVLLSGFGGDEVVSARTGFAWNDFIDEKQWRMFFNALKYEKKGNLRAAIKGIKQFVKFYLLKNKENGSTTGIFTSDLLEKRFKQLAINKRYAEVHQLKTRYFEKHKRQKQLYLSYRQCQKINHPHVSQRLEYSYVAAAQYGIQYRYPLLDKKLIQTFIAYPAWKKHQPGKDRYIFREIIENIVPDEIRLRSDKTGFVIPHINQRLLQDKELITGLIKEFSKQEELREIFDFSGFPAWLNKLIERNKDDINYLMPGAFYNYLMIMFYLGNE